MDAKTKSEEVLKQIQMGPDPLLLDKKVAACLAHNKCQ